MKTKCLICGKKDKNSSLLVTEWLISPPKEAKLGKDKEIHTDCLSGKLYIEKPGGFVYGKIIIK
jgi:hypothetical protein